MYHGSRIWLNLGEFVSRKSVKTAVCHEVYTSHAVCVSHELCQLRRASTCHECRSRVPYATKYTQINHAVCISYELYMSELRRASICHESLSRVPYVAKYTRVTKDV